MRKPKRESIEKRKDVKIEVGKIPGFWTEAKETRLLDTSKSTKKTLKKQFTKISST